MAPTSPPSIHLNNEPSHAEPLWVPPGKVTPPTHLLGSTADFQQGSDARDMPIQQSPLGRLGGKVADAPRPSAAALQHTGAPRLEESAT